MASPGFPNPATRISSARHSCSPRRSYSHVSTPSRDSIYHPQLVYSPKQWVKGCFQERILMAISFLNPVSPEELMHSSPLRNYALQPLFMRMRNSHSMIPTRTESPHQNLSHIKPALFLHPAKYTIPQPFATLRISRVCRTIRSTRNLNNDRCPPTVNEFLTSLRVVRSVAIKTCHQKHHWNLPFLFLLRKPHIHRDLGAIFS